MGLWDDERGQSIQIGAVLLFGVLIIMLAVYQGAVVPSQNSRIEYNHYQTVTRDMVDVRNGVLEAKTSGAPRFQTVALGTEFPPRILAVNPPNPSGTLRTTENKTISLTAANGDTLNDLFNNFAPANRFVQYQPRYAEYRNSGAIRYENTVVYKDFADANVAMSGQQLLQGDRIVLVPVHTEYFQSGEFDASVEPTPGVLESETVEDPTLTLGTELSEDDWEELLAAEIAANDQLDESDITVDEAAEELTIDLTGTYTVQYAPVGVNEAPIGGARGDDSLNLNPVGPGQVEAVAANWVTSNNTVILTFNNTASQSTSFTDGRVAFYDGGITNVNDVSSGGVSRISSPWPIPGEFRELSPSIELLSGETDVKVTFDANINPNQQFFIIEFLLEDGQVATYFIGNDYDNT